MDESIFSLNNGQMKYQLHPVALLEILDHHRRRSNSSHVYGLLVGCRRRKMIEVTGALNILVNLDGNDASIDSNFLSKMVNLHKQVRPKDSILGIYSTDNKPNKLLGKIHKQITRKLKKKNAQDQNSLILLIGCGNNENRIRITCYRSKVLSGICSYVGVQVQLKGSEGENLGLWTLIKSQRLDLKDKDKENKQPLDSLTPLNRSDEVISREMQNVARTMENFRAYCEDEAQRREEVGWDLAAALSEAPCIQQDEFQSMVSGSIEDLLKIAFLSKLSKVHVSSASKLIRTPPKGL